MCNEDLVCFCKFTLINEKIFGEAFLKSNSLNSSISCVVASWGYLVGPGATLFLFDNDNCDPDKDDWDPDKDECDPDKDECDPANDGCDVDNGNGVEVAGVSGRFGLVFVGTSWFRVVTATGIRLWVSPLLLISIFWWIKCDGPAAGPAVPVDWRTGILEPFCWLLLTEWDDWDPRGDANAGQLSVLCANSGFCGLFTGECKWAEAGVTEAWLCTFGAGVCGFGDVTA